MKSFTSFLVEQEVMRVSKDTVLARSLLDDAKKRFTYHTALNLDEKNAKFVFENCYEAIRETLDALLVLHGYKSYSHQAPIVYARDQKLVNQKEALILDNLRDKRNKATYYGKRISAEFVQDKKVFMKKIFERLLAAVKKLSKGNQVMS